MKRLPQFKEKGKSKYEVSPSHSQRQLVSGKVGWGWHQATYPICANFSFAGFLILLGGFGRLFALNDPIILLIAGLLFSLGFLLGIYTSKSVVEVCRQNTDYAFSQWQVIGYLEDGTMVVIEEGREYLGKQIIVVVTSALQTSAGRMIFARHEAIATV